MKRPILKSFLLVSLISTSFAQANTCSEYFKKETKSLKGEVGVSAVADIGAIAIGASLMSNPGVVASVGVLTTSMGLIQLSDLSPVEKKILNMSELLELKKQAELADGDMLREVRLNAMKADPAFNLTLSEVADLVLKADQVGVGCSEKAVRVKDYNNCTPFRHSDLDPDILTRECKTILTGEIVLDQFVPVSKMHELVIKLNKN